MMMYSNLLFLVPNSVTQTEIAKVCQLASFYCARLSLGYILSCANQLAQKYNQHHINGKLVSLGRDLSVPVDDQYLFSAASLHELCEMLSDNGIDLLIYHKAGYNATIIQEMNCLLFNHPNCDLCLLV